MPMNVPQCDPKAGYLARKEQIDGAIAEVLGGGRYILGPQVEAFEHEFAVYLGVDNAVGVANGTDALELALRACDIGPGVGVVTVSHTAVATIAAIERAGATPVLVDIEPGTFTMDPNALEDAVRRDWGVPLKAVIAVHLYGHPADMRAVMAIAPRYGLRVIEDCAQSHGAALCGRKTGSWGDVSAFSFYPTKNLGALGDGGAVATRDPQLGERVRLLREYGWRERYVSSEPGMNSRLDEVQAAVLRVKLEHLDCDNAKRRELAAIYSACLAHTDLELPQCGAEAFHVHHQYVIRSKTRADLRAYLTEQGIGTLIHYPQAIHTQPAYREKLRLGTLDKTEEAIREILSLPMFPELTPEEARLVAQLAADHTAL
jgi:dTDP-4-amino-4,6-dideoxygalactose transaminase